MRLMFLIPVCSVTCLVPARVLCEGVSLLCKQHQHREMKCCGGGWSRVCFESGPLEQLLLWGLLMDVNLQPFVDFTTSCVGLAVCTTYQLIGHMWFLQMTAKDPSCQWWGSCCVLCLEPPVLYCAWPDPDKLTKQVCMATPAKPIIGPSCGATRWGS